MRITIHSGSECFEKEYDTPVLLSTAVKDCGLQLDMPCNGNGTCGKCRVIAEGGLSAPSPREEKLLGQELQKGVRLACMTQALEDCRIRMDKTDAQIVTDGLLPDFTYEPIGKNYGFAVDIGTTTVVIYLYDLSNHQQLDRSSFKNPQSVCGADVVSRIQEYLDGGDGKLQALISSKLNKSFVELCQQNGLETNAIDSIVITGNTTMLYLLCRQDVEPLSHAPFTIDEYFGGLENARRTALPDFPNAGIYLPRTISAFVGSDITCTILSSGLVNREKASVVVDIGTNGEMAVFHNGDLFCCSTAAGPAFEGAGITFGMPASSGAINQVSCADGVLSYTTIHDAPAEGICGSGLIDAISAFVTAGLVDETGYIDECNEAYCDYLTEYHDEPAIRISDNGVVITQKDIRAVQLAKSAICAGIYSLIDAAGLTAEDISELILAGGFGSFINCESAGNMGLIPKELVPKTHSIGNAAGMGAVMILLSQPELNRSEEIAKQAQTLELSTSPFFMDKYIECMMF